MLKQRRNQIVGEFESTLGAWEFGASGMRRATLGPRALPRTQRIGLGAG